MAREELDLAKEAKGRVILKLRNHGWDIDVSVVNQSSLGGNQSFRVNVFSNSALKTSHVYSSLKKALIAACDIVGED